MKRAVAAVFAAAFMAAQPGQAADVLDGLTAMELKYLVEGWGYQGFVHESPEELPQVVVSTKDDAEKEFAVMLTGCEAGDAAFHEKHCKGLMFRTIVKPGHPVKPETYAKWNKGLNLARAYDVGEGRARLRWHVTIEGGVTREHIRAMTNRWREDLATFIETVELAEWE
ncbi:MAG: YbjN domain-containing protein [Alphaproteobacteria bacterium]|nr:YbjN domain-containing protein [Alphaproteobacteria bacterium]MBF0250013.1 YbjN domain-containing protein [Alphaproteobacteria bacterium]